VDRADLLGVEALRLLQPAVYRGIRANKGLLTGGADRGASRYSEDQKKEYDEHLLGGVSAKDRERLRRALKRLFPRLDSVWGNLSYGDDSIAEWERRRRVCARSHFDVYFRLSVGDDVLKKDEIETLVRKAGDGSFVKSSLLTALDVLRSNGETKAALILEELNLHADAVADGDVQPLLTTIFEVADQLDVPQDAAKAFSMGDNRLRIHWLLRRLTLDRFDLGRRSALLLAASKNAPIGWLVDLADSTNAAHRSSEGRQPRLETEQITTKEDADVLNLRALEAIRAAAESGTLVKHAKLAQILHRWREFANDDGEEVQQWTKARLEDDRNIVAFARGFISYGWSHSIADRVARRTVVAHTDELELILDATFFRERVRTLLAETTLSEGDRSALTEFESACVRQESNRRF
jgi:predicted KAP-like P-loop ATPase